VLDPTAGSGTTGIACKNLKRNCVLIDINADAKNIFDIRVKDTKEPVDTKNTDIISFENE
jgi:DNA modification methylase